MERHGRSKANRICILNDRISSPGVASGRPAVIWLLQLALTSLQRDALPPAQSVLDLWRWRNQQDLSFLRHRQPARRDEVKLGSRSVPQWQHHADQSICAGFPSRRSATSRMAPRSPSSAFVGQFVRNPAKPKWIAPEGNPKRIIEWLFPVHAPDRPSHDALRIRFTIDMSLLLIHRWNYGPVYHANLRRLMNSLGQLVGSGYQHLNQSQVFCGQG